MTAARETCAYEAAPGLRCLRVASTSGYCKGHTPKLAFPDVLRPCNVCGGSGQRVVEEDELETYYVTRDAGPLRIESCPACRGKGLRFKKR